MAQSSLPISSYNYQFSDPDTASAPSSSSSSASNYPHSIGSNNESHPMRSPNLLETRRRKTISYESLSPHFHPYSPQQSLRKRNSVHNMVSSSSPSSSSSIYSKSSSNDVHTFRAINDFSFTMQQHPGMVTPDGNTNSSNSSHSDAAAAAAAAAFMPTGMDFTQLMNSQLNQSMAMSPSITAATDGGNQHHYYPHHHHQGGNASGATSHHANPSASDFSHMLVSGQEFQAMHSPGLPNMNLNMNMNMNQATAFNPLATPGSMHARSDCGSPAAFSPIDPSAILSSGQQTPSIARTFLGMRIQDDGSQSPNLGFNPTAAAAAAAAAGMLPSAVNPMAGHPSYPAFRTVSPAQIQQQQQQQQQLQQLQPPSNQSNQQQQQQQQQLSQSIAAAAAAAAAMPSSLSSQSSSIFPNMLGIPFPPGSFASHSGLPPPMPLPPLVHPSGMMVDPQQFQRQLQQSTNAATISPPESPGQMKTLFATPSSSGSSRMPGKDGSNHSLLGPGNIIPEEEDTDSFTINHTTTGLSAAGTTSLAQEIVLNRPRIEVNIDAVRPIIERYISLGGGIGVGTGAAPEDPPGERTVVLMTARVAQKSYGAEKRFLCPPPTVMLLGSQWWTAAPGYDQHGQSDFAYHPPKVTIHIPGDSGDQAGALEWCNAAGQPVLEGAANLANNVEALPVAGRCVAKHLYINDADEKRKRVEISVKIQTAAGHQLGKFDSRPIKVISKPSKKRQSVKNLELCIHHGTTVSLFNRVRSQTVSTKYLGVSSNATTQRWHCPGTFNPNTANAGDAAACFVARTDGWDPFVIWLVEPDPLKRDQQQLLQDQAAEAEATPIGYPPPPGVAMHPRRHVSLSQTTNGNVTAIPSGAQLIPVHYNQLVVLQCLTTGMVSPVMRVRKVEKGSIVTGGAEITSLGDGSEMLGDPVSQLHKVAFEIYQPKPPTATAHMLGANGEAFDESMMFGGGGNPAALLKGFDTTPGTYLACLGDVVGVHPAVDGTKRLISPPHTPKTPILNTAHSNATGGNHRSQSRSDSPQDVRDMSGSSPVPGSPLWSQQQQQQHQHQHSTLGSMSPQAPAPQQILQEPIRSLKRRATQPVLAGAISNGGVHKTSPSVKSIRKVSSLGNFAVNAAAAAAAATAAGGTYYMDPHQPQYPYGVTGGSGSALAGTGTSWNEDVGDASVWTIVGTECVRYTFYHSGTAIANGNGNEPHPQHPLQFQPQLHLAPVTPVPSVHRVTITTANTAPNGGESNATPLVLLSGENFTSDLSVWFGDRCSVQTEWRGRELIACYGPEPIAANDGMSSSSTTGGANQQERREVPLLLVKPEGVIYKTGRTLIV